MTLLSEEQEQFLQMMKDENHPTLINMEDLEILDSVKILAKQIFIVVLDEIKITTKKEDDKINFQLEADDSIAKILGMASDTFLKLMRSYQKLHEDDASDI